MTIRRGRQGRKPLRKINGILHHQHTLALENGNYHLYQLNHFIRDTEWFQGKVGGRR